MSTTVTLTRVSTGPTTADMITDGATVVVNGLVVDVDTVTVCPLALGLLTVSGTVHGMGWRSFRLDESAPVILL
jgi:hypothetical protein